MNTIIHPAALDPALTIARAGAIATLGGQDFYFGGFAAGRDPRATEQRAEGEVLERLFAFDLLYRAAGLPEQLTARSVLDPSTSWPVGADQVLLARKATIGAPDRPGLGASGLGLGPTPEAASAHAVAELLERHLIWALWEGAGAGLAPAGSLTLAEGVVLEQFIASCGLPFACVLATRDDQLLAAGTAVRVDAAAAIEHATSEAVMAFENVRQGSEGLANTEAGRDLLDAQLDPEIARAQLAHLRAMVTCAHPAPMDQPWTLRSLIERVAPTPWSLAVAEIPNPSLHRLIRAFGGDLRSKTDIHPLPCGAPHPFI